MWRSPPAIPPLILEVAAARARSWRSIATVLVGAYGRGIATPDSDVDLAFILPELTGRRLVEAKHGGLAFGLERLSARHLSEIDAYPLLDHKELRIVGRLAGGRVLECRWKQLPAVRKRWERALLRPDCARELFSTAAENVEPDRIARTRSLEDRLWLVQAALGALATLALDLSPLRFQKPKWVVHDLAATGRADLLRLARLAHEGERQLDPAATRARVEAAGEKLEAGLRLGGLQAAGKGTKGAKARDFIRFTFAGARGLATAGDSAGALFTAMTALRVLHDQLAELDPLPDAAAVVAWRAEAIRAVIPGPARDRARLDELIQETRVQGRLLLEEYKQAFAARGKAAGNGS
jgi:predicted nucleotidyltransferase